jgi:hypothetical protein
LIYLFINVAQMRKNGTRLSCQFNWTIESNVSYNWLSFVTLNFSLLESSSLLSRSVKSFQWAIFWFLFSSTLYP